MFKNLSKYVEESPRQKRAMRQEPPSDPIAAAILAGIKKANDRYKSWSDGYWLSDAGVENVMQTYVAEACFKEVKDRGLYVHLEASLTYFFDKESDSRARLDLAVTTKEQVPIYAVELKRGLTDASNDIKKINQILVKWQTPANNGLEAAYWGQFVPWRYTHQCKSLNDRIENAILKFEALTNLKKLNIVWNETSLGKGFWPDGKGGQQEWQAAALVATITRKF